MNGHPWCDVFPNLSQSARKGIDVSLFGQTIPDERSQLSTPTVCASIIISELPTYLVASSGNMRTSRSILLQAQFFEARKYTTHEKFLFHEVKQFDPETRTGLSQTRCRTISSKARVKEQHTRSPVAANETAAFLRRNPSCSTHAACACKIYPDQPSDETSRHSFPKHQSDRSTTLRY